MPSQQAVSVSLCFPPLPHCLSLLCFQNSWERLHSHVWYCRVEEELGPTVQLWFRTKDSTLLLQTHTLLLVSYENRSHYFFFYTYSYFYNGFIKYSLTTRASTFLKPYSRKISHLLAENTYNIHSFHLGTLAKYIAYMISINPYNALKSVPLSPSFKHGKYDTQCK